MPITTIIASFIRVMVALASGALVLGITSRSLARQDQADVEATDEQDASESDQHENSETFTDDEDWYDLDAPTAPDYELDEIYAPETAMFKLDFIDEPISFLIDQQKALEEAIGLRVGAVYTHVYQFASGGPGVRSAGAGDADILFDWALLGRGTENPGRFFFTIEERFRAGPITPSELRGQVGSLVGTAGAFNDRGFVVRDAFWDQRLFDGGFRVIVGRGAPDDYVGSHRLQSTNVGFFNGNLSGNVTTAFPGHGPLFVASIHPAEEFYATAGAANAYSVTTESNFDSLVDEGKIYGFGEIGITPKVHFDDSDQRGRYAVTFWSMPERALNGLPSDWGMSFTFEQYLSEMLWVYARYGFADRGFLTGVEYAWQAALAIDGLLGSPDNITGIGFGYSEPANGELPDEKAIDAFHRFQLTQHTQFSVGAQAIFEPSNNPESDVVGVFSFRLRVEL